MVLYRVLVFYFFSPYNMKSRKGRTKIKGKQTLKKNSKPQTQYEKIAHQLQSYSTDDLLQEYQKLRQMKCTQALKANGRTRLGNKIVDAFTLVERLHTKGHQNVSFYEFWQKRKQYVKKPYVKKMVDFYKNRNVSDVQKFKYIYNLYFSSIAIFRPVMAMEVYCRVNAKRVLDFTMGWGGRLVGACALNLDAYIGIDANRHLIAPYGDLRRFLEKDESNDSQTEITLLFQDALTVDYSRFDYDTVFTSPPYYNLEKYRNTVENKYKTKEEWNRDFYGPLFRKTWTHLQSNGHYCINVPVEIYENACVPILGKCNQKIILKKGKRNPKQATEYSEYIYVWKKK